MLRRFCPICASERLSSRLPARLPRPAILACQDCGLWVSASGPSEAELDSLYLSDYHKSWGDEDVCDDAVSRMKRRTFANFFDRLAHHRTDSGRLLDIGCAFGASLAEGARRGWDVYGIEISPSAACVAQRQFGSRVACGDFRSLEVQEDFYDAVLMADVLEHFAEPVVVMRKVCSILRPSGLVAINVPCVDSLSARILGAHWPQLKAEHVFYPSRKSLELLLARTGFRVLSLDTSVKRLSLAYVARILGWYPVRILSPIAQFITTLLPRCVNELPLPLLSGEVLLMGQKAPAGNFVN